MSLAKVRAELASFTGWTLKYEGFYTASDGGVARVTVEVDKFTFGRDCSAFPRYLTVEVSNEHNPSP